MKLTKRNNVYYLDFYEDGKRRRVSLKTSDLAEARARAKQPIQPKLPKDQLNLKHYINEYLNIRMDQEYNLMLIDSFIGSLKPYEVQQHHYVSYHNHVLKTFNTASTRNKKLLTLQGFVKYLGSKGVTIPPCKFKLERQKQTRHFIYTPEHLKKMCDSADSFMSDLILVLYFTGMRLSEALNLKGDDVAENFIHLYETKSGRARSLPISKNLDEVLPRYIQAKKPSIYAIEKRFRKIKRLSGIDSTARIHDLRHTFATSLCEKGVDVSVVSKLLGHASIQTTLIYARVSDQRATDAIQKLK